MVGQSGLTLGQLLVRRSALLLMSLAGPGLAGGTTCAHAETLYDAFSGAYATNPVLGAQRAAVRIGLQDKAIASTGYAPAITASSDYGYHDQKGSAPGNPSTELTSHPRGYGATLSQNVWNGFKTTNSVAREDASLDAARDDLRNVEQKVMVDVATAYADVLRDKTIVDLRRGDVDALGCRARQVRFQFKIGGVTRTDVDQSDAGLARAQADLTVARTNLDASMAVFRSLVGRDPGRLEAAGVPQKLVPRDLAAALAIAQAEHPAIRSALNAVRAAEINVDVEKAGYAPSIDLTASADHRWDPDFYPAKTDLTDVSVVGRLSFPIYDRGLTSASVHRATEFTSQRMLQLDNQRAEIRATVVQTWGSFAASKMVIASADAQIAANDRALFGVQLEATAGQRTTLDILNAQRSLLDARVSREIAQHDRIIAGYKLLASIGRLSLAALSTADTRGADLSQGAGARRKATGPAADPGPIAAMPLRRSF